MISRHQNAGKIHEIKIANRCFENVAQFGYLETTISNPDLIQKEIMKRLNSGIACYYSVQKHLSSLLLSKTINSEYKKI
jgi:hypothetical protein